jgi:hypothetical protein
MATEKKGQFKIYVDLELMGRMEELYSRMFLMASNGSGRKVKVSVSKSKFWESVIREYVDGYEDLMEELKKRLNKDGGETQL